MYKTKFLNKILTYFQLLVRFFKNNLKNNIFSKQILLQKIFLYKKMHQYNFELKNKKILRMFFKTVLIYILKNN